MQSGAARFLLIAAVIWAASNLFEAAPFFVSVFSPDTDFSGVYGRGYWANLLVFNLMQALADPLLLLAISGGVEALLRTSMAIEEANGGVI
jgi:hypothetical protein